MATQALDQRTAGPTIVRFGTPFAPFLTSGVISGALTGDNVAIAAVAGTVIRVYRIILVAGGATNLTFKDGASTALSGAMPFVNGGSMVLDFQAEPWYTTTAGNAFIINSSGVTIQVSGTIYYIQQ